jgi:hypothetical protein
MIHRKNSYSPCSRRRIGRREAQSREPVNKFKKLPVLQYDHILLLCRLNSPLLPERREDLLEISKYLF